jgi:hypothetical protein
MSSPDCAEPLKDLTKGRADVPNASQAPGTQVRSSLLLIGHDVPPTSHL